MKIATFNVNSVNARLPRLLEWLDEAKPDVVLLQEIKCIDDNFPVLEIKELGYNIASHGQKSYNGVAILSRFEISDIRCGLPGDDNDIQARYIEATINGLRIASIYLPNGNPIDTDKFSYKLSWMDRLINHVRNNLLSLEMPIILGGDYNIVPDDRDIFDADGWADDALCRPESRQRFYSLLNLGLTEAWRAMHPNAAHKYSYWDYVKGRWQKDDGLRIDHFLLSPQAADRLISCEIDKSPRGREKASDHTPVICQIS